MLRSISSQRHDPIIHGERRLQTIDCREIVFYSLAEPLGDAARLGFDDLLLQLERLALAACRAPGPCLPSDLDAANGGVPESIVDEVQTWPPVPHAGERETCGELPARRLPLLARQAIGVRANCSYSGRVRDCASAWPACTTAEASAGQLEHVVLAHHLSGELRQAGRAPAPGSREALHRPVRAAGASPRRLRRLRKSRPPATRAVVSRIGGVMIVTASALARCWSDAAEKNASFTSWRTANTEAFTRV